jgi:hypothetical protein
VVNTPDQVFVHTIEDIIDFAIIEFKHPLNLIPEMPIDDVSELDDFSKEEEFKSGCEDMEDTNTMMKKRETHLRIINLGWPETIWLAQGVSITFPNIHRNYFLNSTLKPQDYVKIISRNSYWLSD